MTSVATPLPIMLTSARNMLMKRSMPRISAMPAMGMVGITDSVATSAMNEAPWTPLAPLDVRTATARIVTCWIESGAYSWLALQTERPASYKGWCHRC